jgi:hypothetical protein
VHEAAEKVNNTMNTGSSRKTYLIIVNATDKPLSIEVSDVDSGDWDGDSRPDKTFHNVEIPPGREKKERQEVNVNHTSAMSTMTFKQENEKVFSIRVDQVAAMCENEATKEFDFGNGWKAQVIVGMDGGETLQYRFQKA